MPRGRGGGGGGIGRGGKKSHKGKSRHFTDPREIEQQEDKEAKAKEWRKKKGIESDEEADEDGQPVNRRGAVGDLPPSGSDSEGDSSDEEDSRHKGIEHLIEVHNPNRGGPKSSRKVTEMDASATTQLSRREKEELEKQEATRRYQQLHAEGKTDEARADMARLAIIRKQREEQAKKKEEERLARESSKKKS